MKTCVTHFARVKTPLNPSQVYLYHRHNTDLRYRIFVLKTPLNPSQVYLYQRHNPTYDVQLRASRSSGHPPETQRRGGGRHLPQMQLHLPNQKPVSHEGQITWLK